MSSSCSIAPCIRCRSDDRRKRTGFCLVGGGGIDNVREERGGGGGGEGVGAWRSGVENGGVAVNLQQSNWRVWESDELSPRVNSSSSDRRGDPSMSLPLLSLSHPNPLTNADFCTRACLDLMPIVHLFPCQSPITSPPLLPLHLSQIFYFRTKTFFHHFFFIHASLFGTTI